MFDTAPVSLWACRVRSGIMCLARGFPSRFLHGAKDRVAGPDEGREVEEKSGSWQPRGTEAAICGAMSAANAGKRARGNSGQGFKSRINGAVLSSWLSPCALMQCVRATNT